MNKCKDSSDKCDEFYKSGKCVKYKNLGEKICKKSCGFCNPSVKDLIELKKKENSIYRTFDPELYSINNNANNRDKLLTFYDIYDDSSKDQDSHILQVKKNINELDETLEVDEVSLEKELLLKSKEESDWNDYLQIQAENKLELEKIKDKYKKNKTGYNLSLKLNRSWDKDLEEVLLKMNNFRLPYNDSDLGKSKKMKKQLTYSDIITAVNIVKRRIDDENEIKRRTSLEKKPVDVPTDQKSSFKLGETKKVKKYIKEEIKPNKKLNDYLNSVLNTISESKETFSDTCNCQDEINITNKTGIKSLFDKIPKFIRYVIVIILLLWVYGIIINQVKIN